MRSLTNNNERVTQKSSKNFIFSHHFSDSYVVLAVKGSAPSG